MSPFDFLNSINDTKVDLFAKDPQNKKDYSAFMVNRGLSYFSDTILYANEMNISRDIPVEWQYDFYLAAIPKRKRFSKWTKKDKIHDQIKLIMKEYNYSERKALDVINILNSEQLTALEAKYSTGGR